MSYVKGHFKFLKNGIINIMRKINTAQIKMVSDFFANLAVIWFAAALINLTNISNSIKSVINGFIFLVFAFSVLKGVKDR